MKIPVDIYTEWFALSNIQIKLLEAGEVEAAPGFKVVNDILYRVEKM